MKRNRQCILGLAVGALGLAVTGCNPGIGAHGHGPDSRTGSLRLVAYASCDAAMDSLRGAARLAATRYRGPAVPTARPEVVQNDAGAARSAPAAGSNAVTAVPDYSGTNVHELGVDEPDIVKTDGSRIVTVTNNVLHTVDAASRRVTGELPLPGRLGAPAELLLRGDWALVLAPSAADPTPLQAAARLADQQLGTSDVLFVDLSGQQPRLAGTLTVDGALIDARQVGGEARLVARSIPRFDAENPAAIDMATISDWLPRYRLSVDGRTTSGSVDCQQVSRPLHFSGLTMLTVYSLDLDAPTPTLGDPATVVADGGVVYGTGSSLYIAADDRWTAVATGGQFAPSSTHTQIYEFDVSRPGRPVFEASGEVPGSLINQYAMSEFDGKLRVVTTAFRTVPGGAWSATSESALYVLQRRGEALNEIGRLEGLGRGERVYSVRFVGATGYVVTFRQTDPLYVVDLSDPTDPAAVGELQLTGYSAYLHPAGDGRLIGVGQEANARGRVLGTQVSLFDVSDPSKPGLMARYQLNGGRSEAEVDPHAFLFWPRTGLVLIPVMPSWNGALGLTIDRATIHELGRVGPGRQIRRSLVIGDTLWTVTDTGLGANQVTTLSAEGWIPFSTRG
jgi:Beta propeller domain